MTYPVLQLKPKREKSILNRHPWIFSGAVAQLPKASDGEIVEVRDHKQQLLAYGFYASGSQIICRLFEFNYPPKSNFIINQEYWNKKLRQAYTLREQYIINKDTNAFRLIHAEGDSFPGLIVDIYHCVAVVQLLIRGTERIYQEIIEALLALGISHIYLKIKGNSQILEQLNLSSGWIGKSPDTELIIRENGLKFYVDVEQGQKTGFFIDQRENRNLLKAYAKGKRVLNTFSYTAGFSLYALVGGALQVHSVDISKDAVAMGEKNISLNGEGQAAHQSWVEDCFSFLKNVPDSYDIIVLDPPAFAKSKKAIPNASRGYISLNELGLKKLKPGGLLFTFSCSGNITNDLFRKIIFTAAAQVHREVRIIHQLNQPLDHPVNIYHPEGEYLKGLVLHVI